ncbi:MAG: hypothetical protein JWQ57_2046, partial [Mucilaginibacter sp.]|nr:hypothetical protein [Mucilaginibacter sp.]MDB5148026.1 hypothetical protein [Mucilaginibacter sp.]
LVHSTDGIGYPAGFDPITENLQIASPDIFSALNATIY